MKTSVSVMALAAGLAGLAHVSVAQAAAGNCEDLAKMKFADATISAAGVTNGNLETPKTSVAAAMTVTKKFCRVTGTIAPTTKFEVWLPLDAEWNGKLQAVGAGGMAGGINYGGLKSATEAGFIGVTSDFGHESGTFDGAWAVGKPDLIVDWGHRSAHEMTVKAKAIAASFYGKPVKYSYFTGCSGAGRQGMMAAQRYPDDFDGIIAGDPTINFGPLAVGGRLWPELSMMRESKGAGYIPAEKYQAIAKASAAACDAKDGITDGIIDDPRQCRFDPAVIQCKGQESADCLTEPQVKALRKIYDGAKTSKGERIFPGFMPGAENVGWGDQLSGKAPKTSMQWSYSEGFLRGMVFEDMTYDTTTFNFDTDMAKVNNKMIKGQSLAKVVNASDTDLSAFKKRGGKLIMYHGWADPGIPPENSTNYYEAVVNGASEGKPTGGMSPAALAETKKYFRLYMVPGMAHCAGGPGPNVFGSLTQTPGAEPKNNLFVALQQWVEKGIAPEEIIATKYTDNQQAKGVERTRPLCPYPQVAKYKGTGSTDQAENFTCKAP